jgi:hypothetical protein
MITGPCAGAATSAGGDAVLPPLTRRQLLTRATTTAVAATMPPVVVPAAVARAHWLRRASYTGRIGEVFQTALADGRMVSLQLTAVENLIGTSPSAKSLQGSEASFLLEFQGPANPHLGQGVRELRHPAFGRGELFVVPEAPARNGSRYAVVVNRPAVKRDHPAPGSRRAGTWG